MQEANSIPETSRARIGVALLTLLGAIALAGASASDATIFVLPLWLLVPCTAVTMACALYLARALRITRTAALLTAVGGLAMAISAGTLLDQGCQRTSTCSARSVATVAPAPVATPALALDWADDAERAAEFVDYPEEAEEGRRNAHTDRDMGIVRFRVNDYYEVWQATLIERLRSQRVEFAFAGSCGMNAERIVYMRAYNDVMRQAMDERHHELGYVSRLSREAHASHSSGSKYEPYIP